MGNEFEKTLERLLRTVKQSNCLHEFHITQTNWYEWKTPENKVMWDTRLSLECRRCGDVGGLELHGDTYDTKVVTIK